ncbi:MAG: YebC/PmpR family DNA-binding transcriptional regulator, partial [Verrucomicrobiota bacterium]
MSGHSKWATIKRAKGAADAKRGKIFSVISKDLTLAARDGGGDPAFNPRLRTVIGKAKEANMPADNVERAIKKGTGELPGVVYEEIVYEGYGQGGVGLIVEVTTDNKNRSASDVRSTMSKNGGNLAGVGAVAFQFDRVGQFMIDVNQISEETLMDL